MYNNWIVYNVKTDHNDSEVEGRMETLTVSAAVRLIPRPPARVLSRKTKMSERDWKSATMSRRSAILDEPSRRM